MSKIGSAFCAYKLLLLTITLATYLSLNILNMLLYKVFLSKFDNLNFSPYKPLALFI